jgi:cell division protein FtsN
MLIGLLIGLGVAAVLYLQGADRSVDLQALFSEPETNTEAPSQTPAPIERERAPAADQPRFRYYELLPEDEVRIPRRDRETPPPSPPVSATPAPEDPVILQTGSFRRFAQADEMKARLSLLGLDPQVHEVQIQGETWYRVHLGPFDDENRIRQALERLRSENIEALRLRYQG